MAVMLSLKSVDLNSDDLQDITRNLCNTLNRETDVEAKQAESNGSTGYKGDPITIGAIILAFLTGGAASSMFNVLQAYLERAPSLEMEFQHPDGKKLTIRAKDVDPEQIENTWQKAREFFKETA